MYVSDEPEAEDMLAAFPAVAITTELPGVILFVNVGEIVPEPVEMAIAVWTSAVM